MESKLSRTTKSLPSQPAAIDPAPQRTCLACRKVKAKRELVRLVRTPDGSIGVDIKGKQAGRGAYLCRARECWETGIGGSRLEHAFRSSVTPENRKHLLEQAEEACKGAI